MSHADFVHLRVHTAYSLSEGAIRVKELTKMCRDMVMPAVAITDTNNLFGGMEFSGGCLGAGIQPILGTQLGVTKVGEGGSRKALRSGPPEEPDQVILLVQNDTGYKNIMKLLSSAYLDSEDGAEPQVVLEAFKESNEGLIALTGGPGGPVGRLLAEGQDEAAETVLLQLKEAFEGRLYIELMRHGLEVEELIEPKLIDLAYKHDIPLVATNEAFFATSDMYEAHDALLCIAASAYVSQDERRKLTVNHRFKSATEMRELFADIPEAIDNTIVIAKRCAAKVHNMPPLLPPYDGGEGRTEEEELRHQSKEGLEKRLEVQLYTPEMSDEERTKIGRPYFERLDYELDVIIQMGFPGYFLIVADFIAWSKVNDIPVGPGRGSGAGSVVAWSLTITDLDPLRFGLLFERFLNPERVSMPDFDIDFCQDRRELVIKYVQDKYGYDHVAQIITFGKLQAKACIRDVGRVLEMPYPQVNRISNLIPANPANPPSLQEALDMEPQLREMIRDEQSVERLFGIAKKLEGLYRHASTHAAGVVIGDRPLDQLVPLYRDPRSDMPVTQYNMKYVENTGLIKFDFLGLKTLTVLARALEHIEERGDTVDLTNLPFDDELTYKMLTKGDTTGVFQLESTGMRDVLRNMKPDSLEDLIAVVALYRPGPMDNIPAYIRRKHGEEEPDYLYPTLKPILEETYGIMIYQEQVMQIAQELSGYTLGGADLLRRAMGKKIKEEMDNQRKIFVEGAVARSVPGQKASEIFDQVNKFAGYGFNKSHAAAYALIAYQTAYLKANYPVEFIAGSMTLDLNNTDKLNVFRQELEKQGIKLLTPDINKSKVTFAVEVLENGERAIRYALAAIKNVGEAAMESVIEEREKNGPYTDIFDFANRLDTKVVNKRQLENLVRSGAFDSLNNNRHQIHSGIEQILNHASQAAKERNGNQIGMFGADDAAVVAAAKLPNKPEWPLMDRLKHEFDALGFYLSAHPLDAYGKTLKRLKALTYSEIVQSGESKPISIAGTIIGKKVKTSKKGNKFAFVDMSDATGAFEVTLFSDQLNAAEGLLEVGQSIFIKGSATFEGEGIRFIANKIESLDEVVARSSSGLKVFVDSEAPLPLIKEILEREGKGRGEVVLTARLSLTKEADVKLKETYSISPQLLQAVKAIPGIVDVQET
ncbi:MAG: DNA polymerase III subunit alpha [Rhodospirillales bacterium]|nr:DNA polymerase III subunit alpha [Rhodospirillales bacterium]